MADIEREVSELRIEVRVLKDELAQVRAKLYDHTNALAASGNFSETIRNLRDSLAEIKESAQWALRTSIVSGITLLGYLLSHFIPGGFK